MSISEPSVVLKGAKDPTRDCVVHYTVERLARKQARFDGRECWKPQLDLDQFRCRAVIDWIELRVRTGRPTQFQHLQKRIEPLVGRTPWVRAVSAGPGRVASAFIIRIQEPTVDVLANVEKELARRFGTDEVIVSAVEVSVDFTPKTASEQARAQMVAILALHHLPKQDVTTNCSDRPRIAWGRGPNATRHLVGWNASSTILDVQLRACPDHDFGLRLDATVYSGSRNASPRWRIMEKILDSQNPADSAARVLADHEKRCRIEVTLHENELERWKVRGISDLRALSFSRLQGDYFHFALPTFRTEFASLRPAAERWIETHRQRRFKNAGVLGLAMLDGAHEAMRADFRKQLLSRLRSQGKRASPRSRSGTGTRKAMVAFEELNRRVAKALDRLAMRCR